MNLSLNILFLFSFCLDYPSAPLGRNKKINPDSYRDEWLRPFAPSPQVPVYSFRKQNLNSYHASENFIKINRLPFEDWQFNNTEKV
jgi:hypothetical protein